MCKHFTGTVSKNIQFKLHYNIQNVCNRAPYRLSCVVLGDEALEFLCQVTVLLTQLGVAGTVLLDLDLDVRQRALEVSGDVLPLQVVLPTPLEGLLLNNHRIQDDAPLGFVPNGTIWSKVVHYIGKSMPVGLPDKLM